MKVLISYAPGDRSFAFTLPVVYARDEVLLEPHEPPDTRPARMRAAVESCDRFIAVLSARYLDSRECEADWRYALSLGKTVRGLLLEACTPPPELADAAELLDVRDAWRGYLGALHTAVNGPAPAPDESGATRKQLTAEDILKTISAPIPESAIDPQKAIPELLGVLVRDMDYERALKELSKPISRKAFEPGRRRWISDGIRALQQGNDAKGLPVLSYLASLETVPADVRARLWIRVGGIQLNSNAPAESLAAYKRAETLQDGRPQLELEIALGEYFRRQGDLEQARKYFTDASINSLSTSALVGRGLLAEAETDWTRADSFYAEALSLFDPVKADLLAVISKIEKEVSATGNLYLQAARALRKDRPADALRAVEIASEKGVRDDTAYPERVALRLKAELLEILGRPTEAAQAFFEAGKRFNWLNQHLLAVDMLDAAHRLHPDHAEMCWYLANSLLMTSYTQEPPNYREEPLRRSMAVWERGIGLALPDADQSWIYTLRAFQLEVAATMPDADRRALYWEAVAMIERGIALNENEVNRWHILGRTHRNLLNEATSMQAVRRSLQLAPDNPTILEEAVIVLTNAAEFDEVAPLIERFSTITPDSAWSEAVRAFVTLRRGDPKAALKLTERAFELMPEAERQPWFYELRADVYRMLGQPERAEEDYRWLWQRRDEARFATSATSFGWAAFYLGQAAEAVPFLERGLREATELPAAVHISLGLCHFALGDTPRGESEVMEGVRLMVNGREVSQFLDLDYPDAVRFSQKWPNGEAVRAALDRARQSVIEHRAEIEAPDSPLAELEAHRGEAAAETGSWRYIGATAGLARLYPDEERWADALACCRDLIAHPDQFPEAPARLQKALDSYLGEAKDSAADDPAGALAIYEELLAGYADDAGFQAELQAGIGSVKVAQGEESAAAFSAAIELFRESGVPQPGQRLGELCRELVPDAAGYWAFQAAWQTLASARPDLRDELDAAQHGLSVYLESYFQMSLTGNASAPGAPPIVVELAANMVPADTGPEWALRKTYIPAMRENIQRDTGVTVPGVLIRENEGTLPPGAFVISLEDVPVYYEAIPAEALSQADPLTFVMARMEGVLRQNLAGFLGLQEVEFLLDAWKAGRHLVPDAAARLRFGRVLRALVWEGVPLTRPADILAAVEQHGLSDDDIDPLLRSIRLRLKDLLPVSLPRAELPEEVEAVLAAGIVRGPDGGRAFLALEPEAAQEVIAGLRRLREEDSAFQVLVVRDPALRPYVKGMAQYELPGIQALAQEELPDAGA